MVHAQTTTTAPVTFEMGNGNILLVRNGTDPILRTVCDDEFTWATGAVPLCRMMGATDLSKVFWTANADNAFEYDIGLDDLVCPTTATTLSQCQYTATHNCFAMEAVQLFCYGKALLNKISSTGQLVLSYDDGVTWGQVSASGVTQTTVNNLCTLMGYTNTSAFRMWPVPGANSKYFNLTCPNGATDFSMCNYAYNPVLGNTGDPTAITALGIDCGTVLAGWQFSINPADHLLLATRVGTTARGSVCDDYFTSDTAHLLCRTMGYPASVTPTVWSNASGSGRHYPIVLDDVVCPSTANSFSASEGCTWIETPACGHSEDVYMSCEAVPVADYTFMIDPQTHVLFAAKSTTPTAWSTVCNDDMSLTTAKQICRLMGYTGDLGKVSWWTARNMASGPIALANVVCPPGTTSFSGNCTYKESGRFTCSHYEDVALSCDGTGRIFDAMLDGMPGSVTGYKRLLMQVRGTTGPTSYLYVGATGMTLSSAQNLCRMMGYTDTSKFNFSVINSPTTPVVFDNLVCGPTAKVITDCTFSFADGASLYQNPVALSCGNARGAWQYNLTANSLLLVKAPGTASPPWGTVCDDAFTVPSSQFLCRELGFGDGSNAQFTTVGGGANLPIVLESVSCPPAATGMDSCSYMQRTDCSSYENIGLDCNASVPHYTFAIEPSTMLLLVKLVGATEFGTVCDDC